MSLSFKTLVLNADYKPLTYFPLSVWDWKDSIKAVFLEKVNVVSEYKEVVRSPSISIKIPSVIALKQFIVCSRRPAFTRFNVFLRDEFECQYCLKNETLTFDHILPNLLFNMSSSFFASPQELTIIILSFFNLGANFIASANA